MSDESTVLTPEERLRAVREELRNAVFWTVFHAGAAAIDGRGQLEDVGRQKAAGFVEFGTRTGLFSDAEGKDWTDAIWGRQVLARVMEKWQEVPK